MGREETGFYTQLRCGDDQKPPGGYFFAACTLPENHLNTSQAAVPVTALPDVRNPYVHRLGSLERVVPRQALPKGCRAEHAVLWRKEQRVDGAIHCHSIASSCLLAAAFDKAAVPIAATTASASTTTASGLNSNWMRCSAATRRGIVLKVTLSKWHAATPPQYHASFILSSHRSVFFQMEMHA